MKKIIKIAQWSQMNCIYLPLYVAMQEGLFDQYGIDIKLLPTGNDDEIHHAVMSGKADIGLGDPTFCAMARNNKIDQKNKPYIIAEICSRVALWGMTHSPVIHNIKTEKDLVGLRLGCFPSPSTSHTLLDAAKRNHKRLLKSMQIIEAPIGQQSDLLFADQADIALYIEPFISIAEERGGRVVYSPAQIYKDYSFSALYSSDTFISKNSEVIDNVRKTIQSALDKIHASPEIGVKAAQSLFPELKPALLKRAVKRCLTDKIWPQTISLSPQGWNTALQTRKDAGYLLPAETHHISEIEYKRDFYA